MDLLTGLPDAYGRGRIIGDYRRIALYGIDFLIAEKKKDLKELKVTCLDEIIRLREEVSEQIRALSRNKEYGSYLMELIFQNQLQMQKKQFNLFTLDILAAVKENNGAAMSLGRTSYIS